MSFKPRRRSIPAIPVVRYSTTTETSLAWKIVSRVRARGSISLSRRTQLLQSWPPQPVAQQCPYPLRQRRVSRRSADQNLSKNGERRIRPVPGSSYDSNCTGVVDMIIKLPDDRTQPGMVLLDTKHTGKVDTVIFSKDREHPDYALYDTTGSGKPDLIGYFHNNENEPYRVEKYTAIATRTCACVGRSVGAPTTHGQSTDRPNAQSIVSPQSSAARALQSNFSPVVPSVDHGAIGEHPVHKPTTRALASTRGCDTSCSDRERSSHRRCLRCESQDTGAHYGQAHQISGRN